MISIATFHSFWGREYVETKKHLSVVIIFYTSFRFSIHLMVLFFLVFRFKCFRFFVEAPTAEQTYWGVKERYLKVSNSHVTIKCYVCMFLVTAFFSSILHNSVTQLLKNSKLKHSGFLGARVHRCQNLLNSLLYYIQVGLNRIHKRYI